MKGLADECEGSNLKNDDRKKRFAKVGNDLIDGRLIETETATECGNGGRERRRRGEEKRV